MDAGVQRIRHVSGQPLQRFGRDVLHPRRLPSEQETVSGGPQFGHVARGGEQVPAAITHSGSRARLFGPRVEAVEAIRFVQPVVRRVVGIAQDGVDLLVDGGGLRVSGLGHAVQVDGAR